MISANADQLVTLLSSDGLPAVAAFHRVRLGGLIVSSATLLGGDEDTGLNTVDLVEPVSARYAAVAVERALRAPLRGQDISLLSPEDVVIFKILSTREKDLEDAAAILRRLGDELDVAMMRMEIDRLVAEVAEHNVEERWTRSQFL